MSQALSKRSEEEMEGALILKLKVEVLHSKCYLSKR